ncbi:TAXI family TRAP transporter solute-binding subunit [Chakrabartyella piscis]|uniref:TAXI family TRAP transporter solute-binding subunit n=1 Tax=Chakrabartyella piscis TaxID=2918914 RepID=UPI002958DF3A|nr:TAXI family TRAP transporter solute-binding subunit [Chakrabartyella piscis]
MKRTKIAILMATCLMVGVLTSGCGSSESSDGAKSLTIATGSSGGTYYALGAAMANAWTDDLESITVNSISSGASTENMNLLNAGEVELGLSMNSIADNCYNGEGVYAETGAQTNFKTIGVVYPEVFQIVASAETGAESVSDLAGLSVAIGPVGSGTASSSEIVFAVAGLDMATEISVERDSFTDAVTKMQDNLLDASCAVLSVPASSITELETVKQINFIDISDEELATIQESFPYYTRFVIPTGTYSNTEDINTITCQAALYCAADLDTETVYNITKSLYENAEAVATAHSAGGYISLETALDGITTPLHAGAIQYYEEQGIVIPDELK